MKTLRVALFAARSAAGGSPLGDYVMAYALP
jgi:hypothetical protein